MTAVVQMGRRRATYPRALVTGTDGAVGALWQAAWSQLRAAHPDVEARLAELEHLRPTRFRALQRLGASAGRWAGRCLRGTATPAELLRKLLVWQLAVVDELAPRKDPNAC